MATEPNPAAHYLLALAALPGLGPVAVRALVAAAGHAEGVYTQPMHLLASAAGIGPKILATLADERKTRQALTQAHHEVQSSLKRNCRVLTYLDDDYPEQLRAEPDLPVVLFQQGPLGLGAHPAVALVGSRRPTGYGRAQAARFADAFARAGLNVVSGLAFGIDAEAHRATLAAGGITTAVLGHGLDAIYPPQHRTLAQQIAQQGALISEYTLGTRPHANNFPERNRIIAGLCSAVVVIEAAESGGALITARQAFDFNREVYALPGPVDSPTSAGCHSLIRRQMARLVTDPAEVLDDLRLQQGQATDYATPAAPLTAEEQRVLNLLQREAQALDQLALATALPVHDLMTLLLALEFKGVVQQMPGRLFRRL